MRRRKYFKFMDSEDDVREKPGARPLAALLREVFASRMPVFHTPTDGDESREILRDSIWRFGRAKFWP